MEEWKQYKLIEVLDKLIDYRGKTPKKTSSGVPLITAKIIKNGRIETPTEFISVDDYASWMVRGFPKVGDVVLTTEAPLGEVAQLDNENVALAQRIVTLRGKASILDNTYLKYYLMSNVGQQRLKARETGTTVTGIKQSELREVLVDCPPYEFQEKLVSILKSFDDKIEVNRQINENLKQQAQALFKSWFVDFEPFKDQSFVESEFGMIPNGWKVVPLKDVCLNITDGVHNTVKDDPAGEYYLLSCKNIKGGEISIGENERKIDRTTFEKLRKRTKLQQYDILLSSVGTIGEIVFMNEEPVNYEFQRSVAIIKPNADVIPPVFLYYSMKSNKGVIVHAAHGAVQQCLFISDISNFLTIFPPNNIVNQFAEIANEIQNKIFNNTLEMRRIAIIRDTLLPRLISGKIKVTDMGLVDELIKNNIR